MKTNDSYRGIPVEQLWDSRLTGDIGGLRPLHGENNEPDDYWSDSCRQLLEEDEIGKRIQGNRVIEIGPGKNIDFRDYCVEYDAKEYVGVDLFRKPKDVQQMRNTEVSYIRRDALQYLMDRPDESAIIAGFAFFAEELLDSFRLRRAGIDPNSIIEQIAYHVVRVMQKGKSLIAWPVFDSEEYDIFFKRFGLTRNKIDMVYSKPLDEKKHL